MTHFPRDAWSAHAGLDRLLDALDAEAGATRFVGGFVRDTLLGSKTADIDCATQLPPDEVLRRVSKTGFKAVPTGLAHGTITAVLPEAQAFSTFTIGMPCRPIFISVFCAKHGPW